MPAPKGNQNGRAKPGQAKRGAPAKNVILIDGKPFAPVPPAWHTAIAKDGLGVVLDTQHTALAQLAHAGRRVLAQPENEDALLELEGRIEEAEAVLRMQEEKGIIL